MFIFLQDSSIYIGKAILWSAATVMIISVGKKKNASVHKLIRMPSKIQYYVLVTHTILLIQYYNTIANGLLDTD